MSTNNQIIQAIAVDLIIGADKADLGNKFDTGKSYVIFGKTDSTA
jgi:hypothetical protein